MGPVLEGAAKKELRRLLRGGGKVSTVDQNHKTSGGFRKSLEQREVTAWAWPAPGEQAERLEGTEGI